MTLRKRSAHCPIRFRKPDAVVDRQPAAGSGRSDGADCPARASPRAGTGERADEPDRTDDVVMSAAEEQPLTEAVVDEAGTSYLRMMEPDC